MRRAAAAAATGWLTEWKRFENEKLRSKTLPDYLLDKNYLKQLPGCLASSTDSRLRLAAYLARSSRAAAGSPGCLTRLPQRRLQLPQGLP